MLVPHLIHWKNHQHNEICHQHNDSVTQHNDVTNITVTQDCLLSRLESVAVSNYIIPDYVIVKTQAISKVTPVMFTKQSLTLEKVITQKSIIRILYAITSVITI